MDGADCGPFGFFYFDPYGNSIVMDKEKCVV